ncbi:DUF1643 domain-containing protein [Bacillus paranthracis]|uniref:DUF1643 domain-containing protein n=1 Tax=Bacillus paranthracis TaxID=2026186 RepID=UPI002157EA69|nr:DUF1643 domain-containing protein [Bacillus paranthracis]MCR6790484.1 DUF1643 domain-containing protein [Bacillus paranthracis]MED1164913.1 DUF1643 domain-containing protein [Bacillus paranthracis]
MFEKITQTIRLEVMMSKEGDHRYGLLKSWDKKKPVVTIITIYPGEAETVTSDLTMMLITNHLYNQNFGGFYSVNLFSKLGIYNKSNRTLVKAYDTTTDEVIRMCAEGSKQIIFAWGSLPQTSLIAQKRVERIMEMLFDQKEKCFFLSNQLGENCFHPLSSQVRNIWNVIPYKK